VFNRFSGRVFGMAATVPNACKSGDKGSACNCVELN
jgi:hypothetical protein